MSRKSSASRIFEPFRALGFCSNDVPLCIRHHVKYNEIYVVTCVGKAFHTYNSSKLGIISVSNSHPENISCLAADASLVYTGCGNVIRAFARGRLVAHEYHGHDSNVRLLLPFGRHLISVDEDSLLKIWDVVSEDVYLELTFDREQFHITAIVHPSTYLNKILLASEQGQLQLWNVKSAKLLYTFTGWGHGVTAMEQAPAVDVIAIGLSSGDVYLHNIKFDETVVKFRQDWGPITAISFRTDGTPVMATGSPLGHIALWDLEKRRLLSQIRDAHSSSVSGLKYLPSQPLMVTSSGDNSIKIWIFDQPDGSGRLLRDRCGHSAPPNMIRFHSGSEILSAGQDSTLRLFSTIHERHNRSFGRASYNKAETKRSGLKHDKYMMPPVVRFASETARSSDWDCIVAVHSGERLCTTWSYDKHTMGEHKLQHDRFHQNEKRHRNTHAQCCTITSCGNFCILGYTSGHVDVYNLQSGIYRGSYGDTTAHTGSVRGVCVDGLNQCVITGGADQLIRFWRFKKKDLIKELKLESPVADMKLHRDSCLLAVIQDDFTVCLVDLDGRNIVRVYEGHENRVTDVAFSTDGRWLMTASMDATVRTWDVPTSELIDCFRVSSAVTSLCLSLNGEYLATTHVDDVGVYLWSNLSLYIHINIGPLPRDYQPALIVMPTSKRRLDDSAEDEDVEETKEVFPEYKSPEQISDELVTLSLLPSSRWQNLLNLDVIRLRNKPKQPPKKPRAAPFFIPTIPGLVPTLAPLPEEKSESKILKPVLQGEVNLTKFGTELMKAESKSDYIACFGVLKEKGPSAIDHEIRSLAPDWGGTTALMAKFIQLIMHVLETNRDFQVVQAYLGLFLQLHGTVIMKEPEVNRLLKDLYQEQTRAWTKIQDTMNYCLTMVNYLKSSTV